MCYFVYDTQSKQSQPMGLEINLLIDFHSKELNLFK